MRYAILRTTVVGVMVWSATATLFAAEAKDAGQTDNRTELEKLIAEIGKDAPATSGTKPADALKRGAVKNAPPAKPTNATPSNMQKPVATKAPAANVSKKAAPVSHQQELLKRFDADHDGKLSSAERMAAKQALKQEGAAANAAAAGQPLGQALPQANAGGGAGGGAMNGMGMNGQAGNGQAMGGQGQGMGINGQGMGGMGMGGMGMGHGHHPGR